MKKRKPLQADQLAISKRGQGTKTRLDTVELKSMYACASSLMTKTPHLLLTSTPHECLCIFVFLCIKICIYESSTFYDLPEKGNEYVALSVSSNGSYKSS